MPSGARSIEGAPTSTTIFVGETERGPLGPTKIKSRTDYERQFGGYYRARGAQSPAGAPTRLLMPYALDGFYLNGGSTAYILRAVDGTPATARRGSVEASSPGIWGENLFITFMAAGNGDAQRFRIAVVYASPQDDVQRLVEIWDRLSTDPDDENYVVDLLKRSLYVRWTDDGTPPVKPANDTVTVSSGGAPQERDIIKASVRWTAQAEAGAISPRPATRTCSPRVSPASTTPRCWSRVATRCSRGHDRLRGARRRVHRLRREPAASGPLLRRRPAAPERCRQSDDRHDEHRHLHEGHTSSNFAALYYPHVVISDVVGVGRNPTTIVPPAGYVAGLFARTDGRRGVWKAPAGTEATLNSTLALEFELNDLHSDELNPNGVNALRAIPGAGRVVWGARTMQTNSEWRYVPVRRTAIFLRTSIYNGIQWAVFEPNDEPLWASLRTSIGGFMEIQFRNGAFAGRTSDEAYLVKVDAETTTEIDQAAGIVNILVGFAPLRPAEFVVVKLSQKTQSVA